MSGNKKLNIVPKQYNFFPEQIEWLEKLAGVRRTSVSQVLRDLIDNYIKKYSENK